jgi:hypothetical protein
MFLTTISNLGQMTCRIFFGRREQKTCNFSCFQNKIFLKAYRKISMYDCLSVSATGVAATEKDEISFFFTSMGIRNASPESRAPERAKALAKKITRGCRCADVSLCQSASRIPIASRAAWALGAGESLNCTSRRD